MFRSPHTSRGCLLSYILIAFGIVISICVLKSYLNIYNAELDAIKKANLRLRLQLNTCREKINEPSEDYERYRQRLRSNIEYFWVYAKDLLDPLKKQCNQSKLLDRLITAGYEHRLLVLSDLEQMTQADGFDKWRKTEHKALGELVQNHIHQLQNPSSCSDTDVFECSCHTPGCGWGCELNHISECFAVSIGLKRIFFFNSSGFKYNKNGLDEVLLPLSEKCNLDMFAGKPTAVLNQDLEKYPKILTLPHTFFIGRGSYRSKYFPSSIPRKIANRLSKLEIESSGWWAGQISKFVLRYTPVVKQKIEKIISDLNFSSPIVGLHIRRTDKIRNEAKAFSIDQYMYYAKQYFDQLSLSRNITKRKIFLATDEPSLYDEISQKYPEYDILTNTEGTSIAAKVYTTRFSLKGLTGAMIDMHLLLKTDYIVCTFSSNVGRIAHKLMQTERIDGKFRVKSLDAPFFSYQERRRNYTVLISHNAPNEKELNVTRGDIVMIFHRHPANANSSGMLLGFHRKEGFVPRFKLEETPTAVDFDLKV